MSPISSAESAHFALPRRHRLPTVQRVNKAPPPLSIAAAARSALLACAVGALATPAAPAAAQQAAEGVDAAVAGQARALLTQAVRGTRLGNARIEVQIGALDPRLQLAPCRRVEPYLPMGMKPIGRTRVGLRCVEGSVAWNVSLPVTVSVFAPGVVLRQALPTGALLSDDHLTLAEIDWGAVDAQRAFADSQALIGRELLRPLAAGAPVQASDLKQRQWFAAGETVQVTARGAGFAITTEGQAMNPGLEGQPVRVRTVSGRVISGRASGDRAVEVVL